MVNSAIGTIWNQTAYTFMEGKAPASANPSLWRQTRLNNIHGLFEVTQGVYQLRGFDLANMTLIEGENGWIVVDPLMTKETSARAWAFAMQHLPNKPITSVLFTHSHIDHFGGATGLLTSEDAAAGKVRIIAPQGFMEEAVSENVIAGIGMYRRALYMYGSRLPRSERGHIGTGLGKEPAMGSFSILAPTEIITRTPRRKNHRRCKLCLSECAGLGSTGRADLLFTRLQIILRCGNRLPLSPQPLYLAGLQSS